MYIHGEFINRLGERIAVYIVTQGDRTEEKVIGDDADSDFFFPFEDAVTVTSEVNDTFDHLLTHSATINLQARSFEPSLYGQTCRDVVVNIYRGSTCVFAGYAEPLSYSQGYNEAYDDISLSCIDCLSALQYSNYRNIGAAGVTYAKIKGEAGQRTLLSILREVMENVAGGVDLLGGSGYKLFYDGSKALDDTEAERYALMGHVSINELLFLGDSEDDVWTQEEVLTEMMMYLNLHIRQEGLRFYLFDWSTARNGESMLWEDIARDNGDRLSTRPQTIAVSTAIVADCDTQISLGETYNQLVLTDSVTEVENIVESPLDSDSLVAQGNFQKFMTEYIAEGDGTRALNGMKDMCLTDGTDYDAAAQVDWFCWPKTVTKWKFYGLGDSEDIYAKYPADGTNVQQLLSRGMTLGIGGCVCALGKIERNNGGSDNAPVTSVTMDDYLVIAVNGDDREGNLWPTEEGLLKACPVAEYLGNTAGGTFSPADEDTTNYIVISGKLVMNPIMGETATYAEMSQQSYWDNISPFSFPKTVPSRNNGDGRYYTRRYWTAEKWNDEVADDETANALSFRSTWWPYTGSGPQYYEYNYSAVNTATDTIKKVGVLACMLIIGGKCVVEKQKGEYLGTDGIAGTGDGELTDYVWMDFKERSECDSDDEYYQQSFTIGIDPKLKDKIIGTEFDIQKNAPYTTGITAEGTAIPIKMGDKVSGQVRFLILGPVNSEWNNVTRRHPSFWRHTKWSSESVSLLTKTKSILMKDFKVEVMSDNGKIGAVGDESDIVYMSDTKETFVNKKDDLEMKITTALTSAECKKLGVNNSVKLSSPQNENTGVALLAIYDRATGETAKPEQLYVDAYWREWHAPRIVMEQNLTDEGQNVGAWNLYHVPSLGKDFYVQGIGRNLSEGTAQMTLKEVH